MERSYSEYSFFRYKARPALLPGLICLCISVASSAAADRHCFPVLDTFFAIRGYALDAPQSCPDLADQVREDFESALMSARICSCTELTNLFETMLSDLDSIADCAAIPELVALRTEAVEETITACHLY